MLMRRYDTRTFVSTENIMNEAHYENYDSIASAVTSNCSTRNVLEPLATSQKSSSSNALLPEKKVQIRKKTSSRIDCILIVVKENSNLS